MLAQVTDGRKVDAVAATRTLLDRAAEPESVAADGESAGPGRLR